MTTIDDRLDYNSKPSRKYTAVNSNHRVAHKNGYRLGVRTAKQLIHSDILNIIECCLDEDLAIDNFLLAAKLDEYFG